MPRHGNLTITIKVVYIIILLKILWYHLTEIIQLKQNLVDQVETLSADISAPEGKSSLLSITDPVIIRIGESVIVEMISHTLAPKSQAQRSLHLMRVLLISARQLVLSLTSIGAGGLAQPPPCEQKCDSTMQLLLWHFCVVLSVGSWWRRTWTSLKLRCLH